MAVRILDANGNPITSTASALDVNIKSSSGSQTVSGTVTANIGTAGGLALDTTLTGGTQKSKIVDAGGTNVAAVSAVGALKVDGSAVTQPVSGAVSFTAPQHVIVDTAPTTPVTGTFFQSTQPVSAVALPLPTGAATAAKQPALGVAGTPSADVVSVQGVVGGVAQPVSGTVAINNFPASTEISNDVGNPVPVNGTVSVGNFPATQPISAASLPLPTGASTSAKQPAIGTAGTPSSDVLSVQGVAGGTPQPVSGTLAVSNFPATQPVSGTVGVNNFPATQPVSLAVAPTTPVTGTFFQATQPVSAASLPLPTGAATSANQATEIASLASIDAKTPALVSGRQPVDGSGVTQPVSGTVGLAAGAAVIGHVIVDTAPSTPVTGTFFQATQPVSAAALPLPAGAATSANQATPVVKGTQGSTAEPTQDLKDSGRQYLSFTATAAAGVIAEALLTLSQNKQGVVTAGVTSYVITSGKTLRITTIAISVRSAAAAIAFSRLALRHNPAGATIATSPVAYQLPEVNTNSATSGTGAAIVIPIPDGIEFFGNGTQTIGLSHLDQATTNILNVTLTGFEY